MHKKGDSLFEAAPFFLVRTPTLSITDFFNQFLDGDLSAAKKIFDESPFIQEAILIASPLLFQALQSTSPDNQALLSLWKYCIRMTSRCRPFGLFATQSLGSWGDRAEGSLDFANIKRRIRPDMEWLVKVIEKVCADETNFEQMTIRRNSLVTRQGNQYTNSYFIRDQNSKTQSVRATQLIEQILARTKEDIQIFKLLDLILLDNPTLERDKIKIVIHKLIKQEFLWLSLLPSLLTENPFKDFLDKLSLEQRTFFHELEQSFEQYNSKQKNGVATILQISQDMESHQKNNHYVQIDSTLPNTVTLPRNVLDEATDFLTAFWKLSFQSDWFGLKQYHEKFLERYGNHRIVPVADLLNEEVGLGVPSHYENQQTEQKELSAEEKSFRNWLHANYVETLYKQGQEILLTDELVERFTSKAKFKTAMPSLDLYVEVIADSAQHVEKGEFKLLHTSQTWQGGSTLGRFYDVLDKNNKQTFHNFFNEEQKRNAGIHFVESSYLPPLLHSYNVSVHPPFRKEIIDFSPSGKSSLSTESFYVGADEQGFFLTSKKGDTEFFVTQGNLLNHSFAPHFLRFIRDASRSRYQLFLPFRWRELSDMPFVPRLRYGKTIASAAQWNVTLERLSCKDSDSLETFIQLFSKWADQWKMPKFIYLSHEDYKLLLNRFHTSSLTVLRRELKNKKMISLVEKIGQEQGQWLTSSKGKHTAEFTISFFRKESRAVVQKKYPEHLETTSQVRWKLPGSEWLYLKMYLSSEKQGHFLTHELLPFTDFLLKNKLIENWFFIRYKDPKTHLRVRFFGIKEKLIVQLLPYLERWTSQLVQEGKIREVKYESYEREIERYGGVESIQQAEELFCQDTQTVLNLLKQKNEFPSYVVGAISILEMIPLEHQKEFFQKFPIDRTQLSNFREWKTPILAHLEAIRNDNLSNFNLTMAQAFAHRKNSKDFLVKSVSYSLINSLVHMHCNRLFEIENNLEAKARAYACHALSCLSGKLNNPVRS